MASDEAIESAINALSNPKNRAILATLNENPYSVKELADELDVSRATAYRRLEPLEEHDLVTKRMFVSPDGNHYTVYECNFRSAMIMLQGTEFDVTIYRADSVTSKLAEMWEAVRQAGGE